MVYKIVRIVQIERILHEKADVIVIGGGPSGLMAAIAASEQGSKVLLLDKGDKLGRKLGISGGGRCNVTNAKELDELIQFIPGNGRFLYSALTTFGNKDIIAFFEGLGIRLKEEDNGRMFPVSDKAKTVVDALINKVRSQGVQIRVNSPVAEVLYDNGRTVGVKLKTGEVLESHAVIVAVGGNPSRKPGRPVTDMPGQRKPATRSPNCSRQKFRSLRMNLLFKARSCKGCP